VQPGLRVLLLPRQGGPLPGQAVLNTLQTNATLLDDAWGEFLAANGFLVEESIDGPRDLHDAFRVDKGGKPTFDRVLAGLDVLKRHGVEWNALTVVNSRSEGRGLEVYRFLRDDLDATFVQLIPIVERDDDGVSSRTVTADGEPGLNRLCAGYQSFFHHVDESIRVMADLLAVGKDADGVTDWYATHHPRIPLAAAPPSGGAP
jgi:sulfatase maturation enzyme AslB (radical SAM superfamily)